MTPSATTPGDAGGAVMAPAWRLLWTVVGLAAWAWLAAVAQVWLGTPLGERFDAALASPLIHGLSWSAREALSWLARPVLIVGAGALAVVLVLLALRAHRVRAALVAVLVPPASLLVLARINDGWAGLGTESFPSGHAVAGYAVLASVACVWPQPRTTPAPATSGQDRAGQGRVWQDRAGQGRVWRGRAWWVAARRWWAPVAWALGVLTITLGNVTLHAHLPGDVLSAALLVTGVTGLLLGILGPGATGGGSGPRRGTMGPP